MALDSEFLKVLISAPTFPELIGNCLAIILLVAFSGWLMTRRFSVARCRQLPRDSRGSATAVDFVMTMPLYFFMMLLITQLAMVVNSSLIVHYAAYSAARSARVWVWDVGVIEGRLWKATASPLTAIARFERQKASSPSARSRATHAARFVLIAASPVGRNVPASPGSPPDQVLREIVQNSGLDGSSGREASLIRQARYAFDPRNSSVEISGAPFTDTDLTTAEKVVLDVDWAVGGNANAWPIHAEVTYRMWLGVPLVNALLGDGGASGGWTREVKAEVVFL